jgi:Holliday junction resolvasome RuvABC endonuclease subunit
MRSFIPHQAKKTIVATAATKEETQVMVIKILVTSFCDVSLLI